MVGPGRPASHRPRAVITGAAWALLIAGLVALTACNTVEGAGKDIEKTGDAVQDAAD
ncbi:MAG: entericidin A/B family lipoprotein [Phycisphaerales bacterium]|nr:entericidin A/B family lipoprotein [Phycisphaerales bacterium]